MADKKSYTSHATEFSSTHSPVTSLEDPRILEVLTREYTVDGDIAYDDDTYQQALAMSGGDTAKAAQIYQEFQRIWDVMHVIDHQNTDIEHASQLINSFIELEQARIDAIVHPSKTLPPEG